MTYPYNDNRVRSIDHEATYIQGIPCYKNIGNCYTGHMDRDYSSISRLLYQFVNDMVYPYEHNADAVTTTYRLSVRNKHTNNIIYCPSSLSSDGIVRNIADFCFCGNAKRGVDNKPIIQILYSPRGHAFGVDMNLKSDPKGYLPMKDYKSDISGVHHTEIEPCDNDL